MTDEDYILDIGGLGGAGAEPAKSDSSGPGARPFISVYFECCKVYQRVYRNAAGDAYVGWCPRCTRKVTARVGPDGVDARFFRAK